MRKILLGLTASLFFIACKNTETRVFEFAQDFNKEERKIKDPDVKQNKAYYLDKKNVNLDYVISTESADSLQEQDMEILKRVIPNSLKDNPDGKDLLKEGVNITLRIYNKFGIKLKEYPLKDYSVNDL